MSMSNTSRPKAVEALESMHTCVFDPSSAPIQCVDPERIYLTKLKVYVSKDAAVDERLSSSDGFSKLLEDQNKIKEKITRALSKMSFRDPHVLVQLWLAGILDKRRVLTTLDQPFGLGVVDEDLCLYRVKSEQRIFAVDWDHREELASPGRVYCQKLPEWSLDVHTLHTSHGYINLPVFEPDSDSCVGVLEIITSSNHIDYTFEVREVSRELKKEDLKCWQDENLKCPNLFEDFSFYTQVRDERKKNELYRIFVALKSICVGQNIPLAQTWVLCGYSSVVANSGNLERCCSSFNRKCIGKECMSTYGLPAYVQDPRMWGFHKACRERHLDISQGVVGTSLSSFGICFCEDVTRLDEVVYPLGSYARDHKITSCLAICLKSIERDIRYVIELVLPPDNINESYLQSLVSTLTLDIKNVSGVELGNMSSIKCIGAYPHWNLKSPPSPKTLSTEEEVLKEPGNHQPLVKNEVIDVVSDSEDQSMEHMEDQLENAAAGTRPIVVPFFDSNKGKKGGKSKKDKSKKPTKKRKTTETTEISLEEISKHIGMSIGEAAGKLDVSVRTLRKICKGLGISRWPNKNHKSDSLLKSNQTDAVIHTSEGGPTPVLGASCEPVLLEGSAQPETTIRVQNTAAANTSENLIIKATYKEDTVRFPLRLSDGLAKLEELVVERFKLIVGSFRLKSKDKDVDLACDSDLMELASSSRQPDDQTVIRLVVY